MFRNRKKKGGPLLCEGAAEFYATNLPDLPLNPEELHGALCRKAHASLSIQDIDNGPANIDKR